MATDVSNSPGPPSPSREVRALREVIRATQQQLQELQALSKDFSNRPSLVVEEEDELHKRLEELSRRERVLIQRDNVVDDSSDRELTSSISPEYYSPQQPLSPISPGGNRHSVHLPVTPTQPFHTPLVSSFSYIAPTSPQQHPGLHPSTTAVSLPAPSFQGLGLTLIKVFLPEGQWTMLHARPGVTIKQALKKAMQTRDLTTNTCIVYVAQQDKSKKMLIDWTTDTILLGGHELYVEYKENFRQSTTNHHNFGRKTFITLAFCDVCKKLLFQGFRCVTCGLRCHQRCCPKVPIRCSYYDDDILYAYLLAGKHTPAVLQHPHPQTPQIPVAQAFAFPPTPPHANSLQTNSK